MSYKMTEEMIVSFIEYLRCEEHSAATCEKYRRSVLALYLSLPAEKLVEKVEVLRWKERMAKQYAASTVNAMLAALNGFFAFCGWNDLKVKPLKIQKAIFRDKSRELSRDEYLRLLSAAKSMGNARMYYIMETLCSTGMRVSELRFVTAASLSVGYVTVDCKGKQRTVLLTKRLRRSLLKYCRSRGIRSGPIFVTRTGAPMDRSNIWREMQRLCERASVAAEKVFPHNFRHLFAVAFYRLEKDIAKLADLLGHASINTTRIYIMESGEEHERQVERMGLVI